MNQASVHRTVLPAAVARRRVSAADVRELALADESGERQFSDATGASGISGLRRRRELVGVDSVETLAVRVARLDDELTEGPPPALVKIDVEGAELRVLRGAERTLRDVRPVVVFEHGVGEADLYGDTSEELWDLVDDAGCRIFDLAREGPFDRSGFAALFSAPVWNSLAVPQ